MVSYRHDRRRKLMRRWEREGWRRMGWIEEADFGSVKIGGGPVYTAKPGTLPSVAGFRYADWRYEVESSLKTEGCG